MEFHSMKERWGYIGDVYMFLFTIVIYSSNGGFHSARLHARFDSPQSLPALDTFFVTPIKRTDVWPPVEMGMTVCSNPAAAGLHVKGPRLVDYDDSPLVACLLLQEARVGHILNRNPHPNIVRFHGCTATADGRITGLVFDRFEQTLAERLRSDAPINTGGCMAQIRAAVAHLHALGIVHNDIVPENIMFKSSGPALALVDFDLCVVRGFGFPDHRLVPRRATSSFQTDEKAMQRIELLLRQREKDAKRPARRSSKKQNGTVRNQPKPE